LINLESYLCVLTRSASSNLWRLMLTLTYLWLFGSFVLVTVVCIAKCRHSSPSLSGPVFFPGRASAATLQIASARSLHSMSLRKRVSTCCALHHRSAGLFGLYPSQPRQIKGTPKFWQRNPPPAFRQRVGVETAVATKILVGHRWVGFDPNDSQ
jgi:hypothetical protein